MPDDDPDYTGSVPFEFTIGKRPVTVRADDKSMTKGGAVPASTYTADGQLAGETALDGASPSLSCTADGATAGSYDIRWA